MTDAIYAHLGNRVREYRERHDFSQATLGELLDTSAERIQAYEAGEIPIDPAHKHTMTVLFGVSLDELLGFDGVKH